ncbi:uncharacterized protein LOC121923260 isoform X2 [Sceloporus undulatus]|uniref:uncharacterized protein LOC121923260 isoform X2 n=1 Tax=Sceloporus undulatus TaxID=8520 RepID=UPI001C4C6825|nr:uncharacterized protein LOC121923260 isoform X2 [Sceloporus undulatus]
MDQKEYPSMTLLESVFAETAAETDTSCTQNQKFLQHKHAAFYEKSVSGCSPNCSNSSKSRSSSLYSVADTKMGFEELSSIGNRRKYQIQRLLGGEYLRTEGEASITDELTHRKRLSITHIDNNLCENVGIPETQKLKDVGTWSELFLDKCPVGDCIEETGKFDLDHNTENKMVQKGGGKDAIDKSAGNFYLKQFHSDFLSQCVASEYKPEHSEIRNPFTLFNSNTSSLPNKILSPGWTAKHEREGEDIFSSYISGDYEVDGYMCRSAIKNHFQNSHITHKGDEPGVPTLGSQKNETYFWTPLNDSSDEECKECLDVKTNSLSAMESKKSKSSCDTASFFRPTDRKFFSSRVLRGRFCYTETSDSSEESWNPETFEIKEYECKDFRWVEKPEDSTGTINNVECLSEEATKRSIFFNPKSDVKKDLSRDGMLHFQPLQEVTDQRYESETGPIPEMDKSFEEDKHTGKDGAKSTYNSDDCNRDQKKTELTSQRKEPVLQMNSFCGNLSPGPSENSSCKMGSESLNLSYKSTDLCSNSDCILLDLMSHFSDESTAHMFSTFPRCLKGDVKENISEGVVKSIGSTKSGAGELVSARVRADIHHKLFWKDKSYSDDSVLAKYYFYLNYLNESKRRQYEDGNHSFSCQQSSKKAKISILCPHESNSLYEQQAEECMNKDFETFGINCRKDKRTEALKSQSHPEQKESKALFTRISPKHLFNCAPSNNRQIGNPPVSKDKEVFEVRKTETNVLGPKRHWARASIAWSSYGHGGVKPSRSQYVQTPIPGKEAIRKSSWTESRKHHDSAVQDCDEIHLSVAGFIS